MPLFSDAANGGSSSADLNQRRMKIYERIKMPVTITQTPVVCPLADGRLVSSLALSVCRPSQVGKE